MLMYTKEYMFMDMCMHMYACVRRGGGGCPPSATKGVHTERETDINRYMCINMICMHAYMYIGHHLNVSVQGAHTQRQAARNFGH